MQKYAFQIRTKIFDNCMKICAGSYAKICVLKIGKYFIIIQKYVEKIINKQCIFQSAYRNLHKLQILESAKNCNKIKTKAYVKVT